MMPGCFRSRLLGSTIFIAAFAAAAPAVAETAEIEEIVVTAQRRVEKLQDVPVSVSAFTAETIEERGITSIGSLGSYTPNLSIAQSPGNTTAAQIGIRGGIQINPALSWDPAVGIYLDGVYIGKTQGSVFDNADIERIEVLRGPQGTLYGRNTLAGAINLITKAPTGQYGGTASLEYGNYSYVVGRLNVNLPRMGIMSASVTGRIARRDGWVKNVPDTLGVAAGFGTTAAVAAIDELNDMRSDSARLALDFDVSDNFLVAYRYDYNYVNQASTFNQMTSVGTGGIFDPASPTFSQLPLFLYVNANRSETASVDGPSFERQEVQGHSLTANWTANDRLALKSITAYRKLTWKDGLDLDGSPIPIAHTQRMSDYWAWSQEVQASGTINRFNYVAGAYYFSDDGYTRNPQSYFVGSVRFDSNYGFTSKVYAVFGQADYQVLDQLTVSAGVRYSHEKKTVSRLLRGLFAPATSFFTLIPQTDNGAKFNSTTPAFTVSYKPINTVNLYGRYARGFKSGGFNGEADTAAELGTPYRPEKMEAFELGAKTTFLDGRAALNAALFLNKSSNLQLSIFTATNSAASVVQNAGKGTAKGFELEAVAQLADGWRVNAGYGYLDTKYNEFINAGVNVGPDRAFQHAPKSTFNAGIEGRIAQTRYGVVRVFADYAYQSKQFFYPFSLTTTNNPNAFNTQVPGYGIANAKLALAEIPLGSAEGEVAFWMRNVGDKKYVANWIDFGPGFGNLRPTNFGTPRTFGGTLKVRW